MERFEEWDVTIPPIPPRSHLFRLEPIGIGTPYVESLTSYVTRLAEAHCVSLKAMVMWEIFPSQGQDFTKLDQCRYLSRLLREDGPSLNSIGSITRQWVEMLQSLTLYDGLRFLTMLTWSEVTAVRKLVRQRKAWCPGCYDEWQQAHQVLYEPLLWALQSVQICPHHRQQLVTMCLHCQATLPFFSQVAHPGYCTHCTHWLGSASLLADAKYALIDVDDFERQCWLAERVGELLAAAPKLPMAPPKEQIATMLRVFLNQYGNISALARMMKVTPQCLWGYLHSDSVPNFELLLQLCYTLSISPLEFLTESSILSHGFLHSPVNDLPALSRSKGKWITKDDVLQMRLVLETLLSKEEIAHYPNLKEIAQRIGCSVEALRRHCPDLCRASTKRYKRQWTEENARIRMRQAIESALASSEPVSLGAVAREIGCDTSILRKYFPDLCQAIVKRYRERFDFERIQ